MGQHFYSFASTGLKKNYCKSFQTRYEANRYMYRLVEKLGLEFVEIYDDNHDKTYIMNDNIRFYIQRA